MQLNEPPNELFAAHPEIFGGALPIRGGWGYSFEDAVIVAGDNWFRGVSVEYEFVDRRNHAELVFCKSDSEVMVELNKKLLMQNLSSFERGHYDVLKFELSVLPKQALDMLRLMREYFFDITGFYGKFRPLL